MKVFILLLCSFFHYNIDTRIVDALSKISDKVSENELSLLVTYAIYESGGRVNPIPLSWDAKAGISCGPWQEPCKYVDNKSIYEQAQFWIWTYRHGGLANLDSDVKRAEKREKLAEMALSFTKQKMKEGKDAYP